MFTKTRERLREEAEARLTAALTGDEARPIVGDITGGQAISISAPLVAALGRRHPMRVRRLRRELEWAVEAGLELGLDVQADLP